MLSTMGGSGEITHHGADDRSQREGIQSGFNEKPRNHACPEFSAFVDQKEGGDECSHDAEIDPDVSPDLAAGERKEKLCGEIDAVANPVGEQNTDLIDNEERQYQKEARVEVSGGCSVLFETDSHDDASGVASGFAKRSLSNAAENSHHRESTVHLTGGKQRGGATYSAGMLSGERVVATDGGYDTKPTRQMMAEHVVGYLQWPT